MVKSMCAKFYAKIIIFPGIMEGAIMPPPHPWGAPKKPILNRVNFCGLLYCKTTKIL